MMNNKQQVIVAILLVVAGFTLAIVFANSDNITLDFEYHWKGGEYQLNMANLSPNQAKELLTYLTKECKDND